MTIIQYALPEVPLDLAIRNSLKEKDVALSDGAKIAEFATVLNSWAPVFPEKPVPYNFIEKVLGIPSKSFITDASRERIKLYLDQMYFPGQTVIKPDIFNATLPGGFIYLQYNLGPPEAPNPLYVGAGLNKIHLFPKDEYLYWCLAKLHTFAKSSVAKYPQNQFQMKYNVSSYRVKKLTAADTMITSLVGDGGIVPTIVVYGSSDQEIMKGFLVSILDLFRGEEDLLGEMDMDDPEFISPFNIRLNPLISYAGGDRSRTLDAMIEIQRGRKTYASLVPKFSIPYWLQQTQTTLCPRDPDRLNQQTLEMFGIKVCENNAPIDLAKICSESFDVAKKFCFLEQEGNPIIDPFPLYIDYKIRRMKSKLVINHPEPSESQGIPLIPARRKARDVCSSGCCGRNGCTIAGHRKRKSRKTKRKGMRKTRRTH